jgi:hypothetical protein
MKASAGSIALALAMAAAAPVAQAAAAVCEARSGPVRARLVELYTSEGCSSCPPADRWLSAQIARDPGTVALAFHVDYWDYLGWRDRWAEAAYSRRQRERVAAEGSRTVYTPQVMVDGRSWLGWRGASRLPGADEPPGATLEMRLTGGSSPALQVRGAISDPSQADGAALYVALIEHALGSQVTAGENAGERLTHDAVVRRIDGPYPFARGPVQVRTVDAAPPADAVPDRSAWVAFVQRPADGKVLQALRLPLAGCAASKGGTSR